MYTGGPRLVSDHSLRWCHVGNGNCLFKTIMVAKNDSKC